MSGRIRSIKPELLEDDLAAALSDAAWRLWVSCWVLADDHGNLRASAKSLGASVWHDTTRDVDGPLMEAIGAGFLEPYSVRGQRYAHIKNWDKHQRVDNAGNPRVPPQTEDDGEWRHILSAILAETRGEPPPDGEASPEDSAKFGSRARLRSPAAGSTIPTTITTTTTTTGPAANGAADSARVRGTRMRPDWQPSSQVIDKLAEQGVDARDVRRCVPEFVDYWLAIPGQRGLKCDWDATFRNRVRQLVSEGRISGVMPVAKRIEPTEPEGPVVPMPPEAKAALEELMARELEPARRRPRGASDIAAIESKGGA